MRQLFLITCLVVGSSTLSAQTKPSAAPELKSPRDKVSYAIGINIGRQFKQQGMDVDPALVVAGMAVMLDDAEPLLTPAQIEQAFAEYRQQQKDEGKAAAKEFLTANAKKEGVKITKSGMQYKILREGTGAIPTAKDTVSTHYRGKFINGKVFDESYKGKAPSSLDKEVSFGVTQVIAGWTEALQMMKVGSKYQLFIPPELAYGEDGRPGIPANSLLIFDIELMGIK